MHRLEKAPRPPSLQDLLCLSATWWCHPFLCWGWFFPGNYIPKRMICLICLNLTLIFLVWAVIPELSKWRTAHRIPMGRKVHSQIHEWLIWKWYIDSLWILFMLAYFGCLSILNKFVHSFCFAQFQVNYANSRFEFGRGYTMGSEHLWIAVCKDRSGQVLKKEQKVNTFDGWTYIGDCLTPKKVALEVQVDYFWGFSFAKIIAFGTALSSIPVFC